MSAATRVVLAARSVPARSSAAQERVAQERAPQLPALTGLRFFAAALVLLSHATGGPFHIGHLEPPTGRGLLPVLARAAYALLGSGAQGVTFFFILSGFILTHSYVRKDGSLRGSRTRFYRARFARIYPTYLCAWALAAIPTILAGHSGVPLWAVAAATLALVQGWFPAIVMTWNSPSWSLCAEGFFYLLFPLAAAALARLRPGALLCTMALCWALTVVGPALYLWQAPHLAPEQASYWRTVLHFHPLLGLPDFVLGLALGRLYALRPALLLRLCARPALRAGVLGALLCALLAIAQGPVVLQYNGLPTGLWAALILALAVRPGRLGALLSSGLCLALGEASYALYLVHVPLGFWLNSLLPAPEGGALGSAAYFGAYVALCVACSLLVLRYVERPGRRLLLASPAPHLGRPLLLTRGRLLA